MAKDAKGHGSEKRGGVAPSQRGKDAAARLEKRSPVSDIMQRRADFAAQVKANKAAAKKGSPVNKREKLFTNSPKVQREMGRVAKAEVQRSRKGKK
jgi:hypothetical protein